MRWGSINDTGKTQCDFTHLRINQTVPSPRSQVDSLWIFANEVLGPQILVHVTTYRLPPSFCFLFFNSPRFVHNQRKKVICALNDDHLVNIDIIGVLSDFINFVLPFALTSLWGSQCTLWFFCIKVQTFFFPQYAAIFFHEAWTKSNTALLKHVWLWTPKHLVY